MFGGLTVVAMVIVYFFVPEVSRLGRAGHESVNVDRYLPQTSGRTPQEMDELYSRGIPARKFHKTETEAQKARRAPEA